LLVYKILFGLLHANSNELFTLRVQPHLRGHKDIIVKQRSVHRIRESIFFSNGVVNQLEMHVRLICTFKFYSLTYLLNVWNNLPVDSDFSKFQQMYYITK